MYELVLFLSISALVTACVYGVYGVYAIRLLITRRRESQAAISQQVQVDSNHHRMAHHQETTP